MNPFTQELSSITPEETKKNLFTNAMLGKWGEVISIYEQHRTAHMAKITKSGDTAIHIAISDSQEAVVKELVSLVADESPGALSIENELGDTPLHLAALLGNVRMCDCIASRDSNLIGKRNKDDETPLFLAVLHGKKDAFLCLYQLCKNGEGKKYYRRKYDGETILHVAISGEYFELAFIIIHLYKKLVNSVNGQGFTPLHLLASKPSAFRSGSHIRGFHKLIYNCIFVDEIELRARVSPVSQWLKYEEDKANYPENYHSCVGFGILLKKAIKLLVGHGKVQTNQQPDAEDPMRYDIDLQQVSSQGNRNIQQSEGEELNEKNIKQANKSSIHEAERQQVFPLNYMTCFQGLELLSKAMLIILGLGSMELVKIREKKEKHVWSIQIMEKILEDASLYEYEDNGRNPRHLISRKDGETVPYTLIDGCNVDFNPDSLAKPITPDDNNLTPPGDNFSKTGQNNKEERINETNGKGNGNELPEAEKRETPILIAAKNGVMEMVEIILTKYPVAIHDMNSEKKNVVLLAVENRQPHVYSFLCELKKMKETIFRKLDKDGNSALHLAAKMGDHRAWLIPGAALQMQWEIKWYEFVKNSMPLHFFVRYNKKGQTPRQIFSDTHQKLVEEGGQWLTNTSQSCSVVAALIATVAFATSATVPGGVKQDSGTPTLENQPAFSIFAISSLIALCFSVTSVVMFLSILTSRYQEKDFARDLPGKLLVGLTSLFVSIASMLVSFCAGHFFVLKDKLKYAAFPVYAATCLPVTFFAIVQFPLYFDLVRATFKKVPQRRYK